MGDDDLLTAHDVAGMLKLRVSTVYDAAARGRLPAIRLWKGRRRTLIRFRRQDIDQLIRARTAGAKDR